MTLYSRVYLKGLSQIIPEAHTVTKNLLFAHFCAEPSQPPSNITGTRTISTSANVSKRLLPILHGFSSNHKVEKKTLKTHDGENWPGRLAGGGGGGGGWGGAQHDLFGQFLVKQLTTYLR